ARPTGRPPHPTSPPRSTTSWASSSRARTSAGRRRRCRRRPSSSCRRSATAVRVALSQTGEMVRERPRGGRFRGWSLDRLTPILMIAPSVVLVAIFVYGFIAYSGFSSLTRWNSVVPDYSFVGLRQYRFLFDDVRFQADV